MGLYIILCICMVFFVLHTIGFITRGSQIGPPSFVLNIIFGLLYLFLIVMISIELLNEEKNKYSRHEFNKKELLGESTDTLHLRFKDGNPISFRMNYVLKNSSKFERMEFGNKLANVFSEVCHNHLQKDSIALECSLQDIGVIVRASNTSVLKFNLTVLK